VYLDDRRPTITPRLARRIFILGGIALALLAVVVFRLWYLQVLSGDRYLAEARQNQVREIKVQAPRGEIVDRKGRVLVDNRSAWAVKVNPVRLPRAQEQRTRLYRRLARVLHMPRREIRTRVREQLRAVPFSTATVKQDVEQPVVAYLEENKSRFPGVTVEPVFLRKYPHREVGAHLFGNVGEINADQLGKPAYRGVTQGDRIGQSGLESNYDRILRGENGATRVQVDAMGTLVPGPLRRREPRAGRQLRLTLDLDVERAGHAAMAGRKGGFVVMETGTGAIRALGSSPSFDPNRLSRIIREADYQALISDANGAPLNNRATQGLYATGSVFKLITATAALDAGIIGPDTVRYDDGLHKVGTGVWRNARGARYGAISLRAAMAVSSDDFFYQLGEELNGTGDGRNLQRWARRYGLGSSTGIDLPAEADGLVPDTRWRARVNKQGIGDGRPWNVGDNINLSVGQGDLQANPLQMAVAYATLANGGRVVRPHLAQRIEEATGAPIQELSFGARRRIRISPEHRQAILDGLRLAASAPKGTSTAVFEGFPIPVAGKTGTAQRIGKVDQAWYVALSPYPDPRYVVAVTFEDGGFGAETAAPAACRILAVLHGVRGKAGTCAGASASE
jgi:penicillin-binding protein 2